MRGHRPLIEARRMGAVPVSVWLHDLADGERPERERFPWPVFGSTAAVAIEVSDSPARLDLRFLVGLRVYVLSEREDRLQALEAAAAAAKAARVIGHLFAPAQGHKPAKLVRITDTEGVLTWHA